ncbi:MAG: hypothetical protein V1701_02660 [Planctomycetota bacterium]
MKEIRIGQKVRTNRAYDKIINHSKIYTPVRGIVAGIDNIHGDVAIIKLSDGRIDRINREWLEPDRE